MDEQEKLYKGNNIIIIITETILGLALIVLLLVGIGIFENKEEKYNRYISAATEYKDNSNYDKAIRFYEKAIDLDTANPQAYLMLSDLYLHLNNDDKAIDILEEGSKYSDDSKLHNTLARLRNNNTVELSPTVNTTNDGEFNTNDICVVKAGKTDVKIRERPVNGSEVAKVNGGKLVQIISSQEGTDGYTWYEVTFDTDDGNIRGYIRSDFIDKTDYIRIEEYPEGTYLD